VHIRWEWEKLQAGDSRYKLDNKGFGVRVSSNPDEWNHYEDKNLPLEDNDIKQLIGEDGERFREFEGAQYAVNPLEITIGDARFPKKFPSGTRLPFTSEKDRNREGWYGTVTEVEVVHGYLTYSNGQNYSHGTQTKNVRFLLNIPCLVS
jgi:hypothetical protein